MSARVLKWTGCGAFFAQCVWRRRRSAPTAAAPYYFSSSAGNSGIESVTNPSSGTTGDFTLQFKSPSSVGVGMHVDTLTINACTDKSCQQSISGSPASVQVTYIVSVKPHIASLGPSTVVAGGPAFMLVITGSHFDSTSEVQVNGIARSTFFISSTALIGDLSAQDIASAGSVQITLADNKISGGTESSPASLTDERDLLLRDVLHGQLHLPDAGEHQRQLALTHSMHIPSVIRRSWA